MQHSDVVLHSIWWILRSIQQSQPLQQCSRNPTMSFYRCFILEWLILTATLICWKEGLLRQSVKAGWYLQFILFIAHVCLISFSALPPHMHFSYWLYSTSIWLTVLTLCHTYACLYSLTYACTSDKHQHMQRRINMKNPCSVLMPGRQFSLSIMNRAFYLLSYPSWSLHFHPEWLRDIVVGAKTLYWYD